MTLKQLLNFNFIFFLFIFSSCLTIDYELIEEDKVIYAFGANSSPTFKGYFYQGSDEEFHYFIEKWKFESDQFFKFKTEDLKLSILFNFGEKEIRTDRFQFDGSTEAGHTEYYKLYAVSEKPDSSLTAEENIPGESAKQIQLAEEDNFNVEAYSVRHSYLFSETEKFVIASKITEGKNDIEGLRLLYFKNNQIKFKSEHIGESYIYKPSFFQFKDSSLLIVCEKGYEYSSGVDVYEYKNSKVKYLGFIDLAANTDDFMTSIVPNMTVEKDTQDNYKFSFKGELYINPGGENEKIINGERIRVKGIKGKLAIDTIAL